MVYPAANKQGFEVHLRGQLYREVVGLDGIQLIRIADTQPMEEKLPLRNGVNGQKAIRHTENPEGKLCTGRLEEAAQGNRCATLPPAKRKEILRNPLDKNGINWRITKSSQKGKLYVIILWNRYKPGIVEKPYSSDFGCWRGCDDEWKENG